MGRLTQKMIRPRHHQGRQVGTREDSQTECRGKIFVGAP